MKIFLKPGFVSAFLLIILIQSVFIPLPKAYAVTTRVDLLTADNFAVLGGSAISDVPTSVITGHVGLSPGGGTSITGLKCSEVTGTIYDTNGGYTGNGGGTACLVTDAGLLTTAKNDLITASNDAAGRTTTSTVATELGGTTLTDGVYDSAAGTFGVTGTLTLDGGGNADSVFIFKMGSTLITASSSQVVLTNSAQACNVYWLVGSSATLGTSTTLVGNVLASDSITDDGNSTINGRLLAKDAAVTLNKTTVTKQTCASPTSTPTPTPTPTSTSTSGSSSTSPSGSSSSDSTCTAPEIKYAPTIVESSRTSPTSIFLKWTQADEGLNSYIVQYGTENNKWSYNTTVQGLSVTLSDLPPNQPIWVKVAATGSCGMVGNYGEAKLLAGQGGQGGVVNPNVLGVSFPNTGTGPNESNTPWYIPTGAFVGISTLLVLIIKRKHKCLSTPH